MDDFIFYYDHIPAPPPEVKDAPAAAAPTVAVTPSQTDAAQPSVVDLVDDVHTDQDEDDEQEPEAMDQIHEPFEYEEASFRVYEKVISCEPDTKDADAGVVGDIDDAELPTTARTFRTLLGTVDSSDTCTPFELNITDQSELAPRDFGTECPTYEPVFTRVKDAAAALQTTSATTTSRSNNSSARTHMYAASVFHCEKLYAWHAMRLALATAQCALGCVGRPVIPTRNKLLQLHNTRFSTLNTFRARVPSAYSLHQWLQGPYGTQRMYICPETAQICVQDLAGVTEDVSLPPWLVCIDLEHWLDNNNTRRSTSTRSKEIDVREWLDTLHRYSVFPALSSTVLATLDPCFTNDAACLPPSVWLRAPLPYSMDDKATQKLVALTRAIQPTVVDFTDTPLNDAILQWASDAVATRRLRCIRVRLGAHSHSTRGTHILERLFAFLAKLPVCCTRVEIVRADFTYTQQQTQWENECPKLTHAAVVLVEPISMTNTLLHTLGTRKFKRLSIWKPLTSSVLHSQIHEF